MAHKSKIEWTACTWNPVTGCTKVSSGCLNCYAEAMAGRLQAMGNPRYRNGFAVTLHDDLVGLPLTWRQPSLIFVNSMSDLFHEEVPLSFIKRVFRSVESADWHTFQVLTKRAGRLAELAPDLRWPPNLWMGVSVEDQDCVDRIGHLLSTRAAVKFVSAEPLLGPIDLDVEQLDWLIVGGESGPRARPMRPEWVTALRDKCLEADVPFFFKQWGGVNKKRNGRRLHGRVWDGMPRWAGDVQPALIA